MEPKFVFLYVTLVLRTSSSRTATPRAGQLHPLTPSEQQVLKVVEDLPQPNSNIQLLQQANVHVIDVRPHTVHHKLDCARIEE